MFRPLAGAPSLCLAPLALHQARTIHRVSTTINACCATAKLLIASGQRYNHTDYNTGAAGLTSQQQPVSDRCRLSLYRRAPGSGCNGGSCVATDSSIGACAGEQIRHRQEQYGRTLRCRDVPCAGVTARRNKRVECLARYSAHECLLKVDIWHGAPWVGQPSKSWHSTG